MTKNKTRFGRSYSQSDANFPGFEVQGRVTVAEFELPTDSYNDLRARIAWRLLRGDMTADLFLAGRNLTDEEQRLHTSDVKDLAPQPGRTIETGLRMRF